MSTCFYISIAIVSMVVLMKSLKHGFIQVLSHTRELVLTLNFLTIVYLRSFHVVYFTASAIITVILAKILKNTLKHPRPNTTTKDSYGMPSSHSAAIMYMTAYISTVMSPTWQNLIVLLLFHGFSLAVVWSRVRLGHHTPSQVIAGSTFGITCAFIASYLWYHCFYKYELDMYTTLHNKYWDSFIINFSLAVKKANGGHAKF